MTQKVDAEKEKYEKVAKIAVKVKKYQHLDRLLPALFGYQGMSSYF